MDRRYAAACAYLASLPDDLFPKLPRSTAPYSFDFQHITWTQHPSPSLLTWLLLNTTTIPTAANPDFVYHRSRL